MKDILFYILIAVALLIGYAALSGALSEKGAKRPSPNDPVQQSLEKGRTVGRKSGKTFESVQPGRNK